MQSADGVNDITAYTANYYCYTQYFTKQEIPCCVAQTYVHEGCGSLYVMLKFTVRNSSCILFSAHHWLVPWTAHKVGMVCCYCTQQWCGTSVQYHCHVPPNEAWAVHPYPREHIYFHPVKNCATQEVIIMVALY